MKLRIFLSYSKVDASVAVRIATGLRAEDHEVFFDQTDLPAGDSYDAQIRAAVESSDLFVFLISPDAVEKGRYARTELSHARRQWPSPAGHVLPVMVRATPYSELPGYLKTVTVLEPAGNIPADIAAAVNRLTRKSHGTLARRMGISAAALVGLATVVVVATWVVGNIGNGGTKGRDHRYLVSWFGDLNPSDCYDIEVSHPGGVIVAREQNNDLFEIGGCNLSIEAAALELIGDVRISAFTESAAGYAGPAAAGAAQPPAEGTDDNRDGIDGGPGRRGANGRDGKTGKNAGRVDLRGDGWRGVGSLSVDLKGQNGGRGQSGGPGGLGQQGAKGRKAESGVVKCRHKPGVGGDGGLGGGGGAGGNGGGGGKGGVVYRSVAAEQAIVDGKLGVDVSGGQGGAPGSGGACGPPGEPGSRGLGSTLCKVRDRPWRWGNPGEGCLGSGSDGRSGEDGQPGQTLPLAPLTVGVR